jgi:murein L,D-transpeptidase YcbB/YkuD
VIVEKTNAAAGAIGNGSTEQGWIRTYVNTRKAWLTARSPLLAKTTYRMDAFTTLMTSNKWNLDLPISFLHYAIDVSDLGQPTPIRVAAEDSYSRPLYLAEPFLFGPEVVRVQQALQQKGLSCNPDGIYGNYTATLVRVFQQRSGLTADGIVGPLTWKLLVAG